MIASQQVLQDFCFVLSGSIVHICRNICILAKASFQEKQVFCHATAVTLGFFLLDHKLYVQKYAQGTAL